MGISKTSVSKILIAHQCARPPPQPLPARGRGLEIYAALRSFASFFSTISRFNRDRWSMKRMPRSEEHTSELQSIMRISYAVFCLKEKTKLSYKLKKQSNVVTYVNSNIDSIST